MKRLATLTCVLALGCSASKSPSDTPSKATTAGPKQPAADTGEAADEPPAPDFVQLSPTESTLTVPLETELRYSYKSHASVGYGAKFEIGDPAVLQHLRTDMEYAQSEAERADKDGADGGTATFVFQASAPGSTTLRVMELFRGETEEEIEFALTVVQP
ncbi:MAG: protease inhibitor I42 family protein [Enhygromyxa sp.]